MTFGPNHYMPVLKVKRGEKHALASIRRELRQQVTPLLEIVARKKEFTIDEHLTTGFKNLAASLDGYSRCLLDLREIEADGVTGANQAFARALSENISFTPVTGISRTADVASAVNLSSSRGIAIRVTRAELEGGHLTDDLNSFVSAYGLTPDRVDLIIDLGAVNELIVAGAMALTQAFLADVPNKQHWRTLTVSGSAFPLSMAVVNRNSDARIARSESSMARWPV